VDEIDAATIASATGDEEIAQSKLRELEGNDPSLRALIKVLLDVKTLPHIVLIFVLSTVFYFLSTRGAEGISALGFLSLTGGYLLLGLLAKNDRIDRLTRLPEEHESEGVGRIKRLIFSFRICLLPLAFSLGWLLIFFAVMGGEGFGKDILETLPFVMGSLFVFWAVMQGRSFSHWLSSVAALKLPKDEPWNGGIKRSIGFQIFLLSCLSILILAGVEMLQGEGQGIQQAMLNNFLFFIGFAVLFGISIALTWNLRVLASRHLSLHRFSSRWVLLTQAMITWHFLTVWRHTYMSSGGPIMLIEELLLMISTVFMAIWGLTSRSYRSSFRLVDEHNALPIGLAFGYAYAGSVAMLTNVLDDIREVMVSGHIVVILTFFWMQRRVLTSVLNDHDSSVEIRRTVKGNDAETVSVEEPQVAISAEVSVDSSSDSPKEQVPDESPSSAEGGISVDEEWDANTTKDIGADVEWASSDVIDLDD